jgi:hypothetical protein
MAEDTTTTSDQGNDLEKGVIEKREAAGMRKRHVRTVFESEDRQYVSHRSSYPSTLTKANQTQLAQDRRNGTHEAFRHVLLRADHPVVGIIYGIYLWDFIS